MWILFVPAFLFLEIRYLIKHPWSLNWTAWIVWTAITAASFLFLLNIKLIGFMPVTHAIAGITYYYLKINLNRRRPGVMRRHHQHYLRTPHKKVISK